MTVRFVTLGCKVNQVESQALAQQFAGEGALVVTEGPADVIVLNSCTVTAEADRKTRQTLHRLRRENPDAVLVLTGCYPQASPEGAALLGADVIAGNANRAEIFSLVQKFMAEKTPCSAVLPHTAGEGFEPLFAGKFDARFQKAYLKIEDGCDRYCAYCIIPKARGAVRSLPLSEVKQRAGILIENGYREIVLTGINLSRYGAENGQTLADAVEAIDSLAGDFRIRLGSVEPDLLSVRDWQRLAACKKLCPHFHLALQSGCDATLARMGRRYTTAQYLETADRVRALFRGASVTTDIIVGFPGETEEEFAETCAFVRSLGLLRAHLFPYSPRPGTRAARLPDRVPPETARRRSRLLRRIVDESAHAIAASQIGRTVRVLAEADGTGSADDSLEVLLPPGCTPGELFRMRLIGCDGARCFGERV